MTKRTFTYILALVFIGTLGIFTNLANAQFITDGLISHWTFDDIDGDTVVDVVGDNDGTMMGGPQVVAGKIGQALSFDGVDDFVDIPGTASLDFNGKTEFTAAAWINIEGHSGSCCDPIVAQRDSQGWALRYDERNVGLELELIVHNPAWVGDGDDFGAPAPPPGEWHFITGVLTGDEILLYVDDNLESQLGFTDSIVSVGTETEIGGALDGQFMGIIDEVLIYDRALDAEEVRQNFLTISHVAVEPAGKLAARWAEIKVSR